MEREQRTVSKTIYSFIFCLHNHVGHIYEYHQSIRKCCQLNQWRHVGLVSKSCKIKNLPKNWIKSLPKDHWERKKSLWGVFRSFLGNAFVMEKFFRKAKSERQIVFLEHFSFHHIAAIFVALLFSKPKCQFWIFHRFVFPLNHYKTKFFIWFHTFIEWKMGKNSLRLLTDSELLAKQQKKIYKRNIHILPIPHTYSLLDEKRKKKDKIILWWPGGSTRVDKGLKNVQHIAKIIEKTRHFQLIVAKSAKDNISSKNVYFIPSNITREKYCALMESVHFAVLPYLAKDYKYRSSGIFVEAVTMGAIPLVTEDTWMAYELEKYDLQELVMNWDLPDISHLQNILEDKKVIGKFKQMQESYRKFHNLVSFSERLKKL